MADIAFVCLLAAVVGHLMENIFVPFTTDFIRIFYSPCANLADVYAYSGLAALTFESITYYRFEKQHPSFQPTKGWLPLIVWRFFLELCRGRK